MRAILRQLQTLPPPPGKMLLQNDLVEGRNPERGIGDVGGKELCGNRKRKSWGGNLGGGVC